MVFFDYIFLAFENKFGPAGNIPIRLGSIVRTGGGKRGPKYETAGINTECEISMMLFKVMIQGDPKQPILVRILDIAGRLMDFYEVLSGTALHFGDNYKSGLYLIQVTQETDIGHEREMCLQF